MYTMAMIASIVIAIIFVIAIIMLLFALFLGLRHPLPSSIKADAERLLALEDPEQLPSHRTESFNFDIPESSQAIELSSSHAETQALDVGDQAEDLLVGQTLRRPLLTSHVIEEQKCVIKEGQNHDSRLRPDDVSFRSFSKDIFDQGADSCLFLEVITGPALEFCHSVLSTDASKLPITFGRVLPSDVLLKDSEKSKWELMDMGSLNGTLLNTNAIHHPDSGSRTWGEAKELVDGDVITLGITSQISVQITPPTQSEVPFGLGIASDPMSTRRGGKQLPMEDVCFYQWPLPGAEQFGLFGICDGHGGAVAAQSVSKILPEKIASILLDSLRREKVFSRQDVSDVLREAISQTEACLTDYYEGCTVTVLLVWGDGSGSFFAQCANVGDSACVTNIGGRLYKMTEDHRISSYSEKQCINEMGNPLKDGDTRLCGLNLGRMLGDKFLKKQDARFSSEPYISQVVQVGQGSESFALLASDGLWDVVIDKKACQFVIQAKEKYSSDRKGSAQRVANFLLNEAQKLRTKDNTSIIYVDFGTALEYLVLI